MAHKASSFQILPINEYKTVLKPEISAHQNYRIFPTFMNVRELPVSDYDSAIAGGDMIVNPLQPTTLQHTINAYYFSPVFTYNGLEFRFYFSHGQKLLYKRGLTRHETYQYRLLSEPKYEIWEVDANGSIYILANVLDKLEIQVALDNYEITVKVPNNNLHYYCIDDIPFAFPFSNYTATVKWHLPDMGGTIK